MKKELKSLIQELGISPEDCDKYYKTVYQIEALPSQFLIDMK